MFYKIPGVCVAPGILHNWTHGIFRRIRICFVDGSLNKTSVIQLLYVGLSEQKFNQTVDIYEYNRYNQLVKESVGGTELKRKGERDSSYPNPVFLHLFSIVTSLKASPIRRYRLRFCLVAKKNSK